MTAPARRLLRVSPAAVAVVDDPGARPPSEADFEALALLMHAAYRGTTDDAGETQDDARKEVRTLLDGGFGSFLPEHSEIVQRDGAIVSATLVTLWKDVPLVAFSMTAPPWKRRGLARAGLLRTIRRLHAARHTELRLVVTRGNGPAEALYESLGFTDVAS